MGNIIKSIDPRWVRAIVALLLTVSIIVGFFVGMVPASFLKEIALMALSFYFGSKVPTKREEELLEEKLKNSN